MLLIGLSHYVSLLMSHYPLMQWSKLTPLSVVILLIFKMFLTNADTISEEYLVYLNFLMTSSPSG